MNAMDGGVTSRIPASELSEIRRHAKDSRVGIWRAMEDQLGLSPALCRSRLASTLGVAAFDMESLRNCEPDFTLLPYAEAVRRQCLVIKGVSPIVALTDPFDLALQSQLETRLDCSPEWRLVHPSDLAAYFAVHEDKLRAIDSALDSIAAEANERTLADDITLASIAKDTSPVVRLVNSTIYDAMRSLASDIHMETIANGLRVKYRIDGVLAEIAEIPGLETASQVVSRIKVMAELDIAERRVPQDGRFKLSMQGSEVDFRVSVMPSLFGEDVVIRILDKRSLTDEIQGLRLDLLGFDPEILIRIRRLAREPYGMMLVTGPTGSGKTTTLYAAISEINNSKDKIVTVEDPVEYQLPGVLQIPVNEKKGLTFARGLRSILRHDPDKILIGEIRDPETAQIAIQSALTGHLVFTSVHANNVFDVLGRFLHMGVDTYSFVSALNGVLAQRLVRVVCPECSEPHRPTDAELEEAAITRTQAQQMGLKLGRGCGHCRGTGYKGRQAIAELLRMNDELRELISARAPIRSIKEAAIANGTHFLRESAIAAAARGITTLEEINRVTFSE